MHKRILWALLLLTPLLVSLPRAEERSGGRRRERPFSHQEASPTPTPGLPGPAIIGHISLEEKLSQPKVDVPTIHDIYSDEELSALRSLQPSAASLPLEPLLQYPELPTGCESVALTISLLGLGFSLEKTDIASDYLVYSDNNFALGYVGDPFADDGAGVFAPGLVRTANIYLKSQGSTRQAYDASGVSFHDLFSFLADGQPVILWVTMSYNSPSFSEDVCSYGGRDYRWFWNEHCVAMKAYDKTAGTVTLEDPLEGELVMDLASIEQLYDEIGYAVVIHG